MTIEILKSMAKEHDALIAAKTQEGVLKFLHDYISKNQCDGSCPLDEIIRRYEEKKDQGIVVGASTVIKWCKELRCKGIIWRH